MGKGKGSGTTPQRVQALLAEAVAAESQYAVAKKTGLALSVIQGVLKGGREPTTGTLTKLSAFLGVPVHELRGEDNPLHSELYGLKTEDKELLRKIAGMLTNQEKGEMYREIFKKLLSISDREQLLRYINIKEIR